MTSRGRWGSFATWLAATLVTVWTGPGVAAGGPSTCSGPAYELAKPFVGTWQEFTVKGDDELLAGTLRATFEVDGCVFTQRFASPDGSFSFMSFGYVDHQAGRWRETLVLSNGRVASYDWSADGDEVLFDRLGSDPPFRLRVMNVKRDSYDVVEERSADGGVTWQRGEITRARRVR